MHCMDTHWWLDLQTTPSLSAQVLLPHAASPHSTGQPLQPTCTHCAHQYYSLTLAVGTHACTPLTYLCIAPATCCRHTFSQCTPEVQREQKQLEGRWMILAPPQGTHGDRTVCKDTRGMEKWSAYKARFIHLPGVLGMHTFSKSVPWYRRSWTACRLKLSSTFV